jgi:hypothetical protein
MGVVGNSGVGGRATHWGLGLAAALLGWGGYFAWIWPRMFFERTGGLVAGWRTLWADWAAHLAYAEVFAQRDPSQWLASHPLHATERFDYPFLADAISGLLMRAGLDRIDAFVWPSLLTSLLLVGLLYAFYARRLESAGRGLLALTLFFTNGGLGFLLYANDLLDTPSATGITFPAREYTWLWRIGGGDAVAVRMWSRSEVELADAFREVAPPDALVLCSDHHHHWVPALAGRRVLLGYRGWLTSYGVDYRSVERDVRHMLQHGDPTLLERYGVDFVVIGEAERESFAARESAFQERWPLVLEGAGSRVYDVRTAGEGS